MDNIVGSSLYTNLSFICDLCGTPKTNGTVDIKTGIGEESKFDRSWVSPFPLSFYKLGNPV